MDSKRQLEIVGLITDPRLIVAKCVAEVNVFFSPQLKLTFFVLLKMSQLFGNSFECAY